MPGKRVLVALVIFTLICSLFSININTATSERGSRTPAKKPGPGPIDSPTINNITFDQAAWSCFGYDVQHTHRSKYDSQHVNGTLKWIYDTSSMIHRSSPAITSYGRTYIGSFDNRLHAVKPDGTQRWSIELNSDDYDSIYSSPAITSNGTILIGSQNDNLSALTPQGDIQWSFKTEGSIYSSPVVDGDGNIYFGSGDKKLYSLSGDGEERWAYQTEGWIRSSPVIGKEGNIYFGSNDHNFYALDKNGTENWNYTTQDEIFSSPAVDSNGNIYVGSWDGHLYSFRPNGSLRWRYDTGNKILSSPAISSNGTVYIGSDDGDLYAVNQSGQLAWAGSTGDSIRSSAAIGKSGNIYVGSNDGKIYSFDSKGKKRWTFQTGKKITSSPAIGPDGDVYVGSQDGSLYAFTGSPSKPNNLSAQGLNEEVYLNWDSPDEDGGHQLTEYNIYKGTISGNITLFDSIDASATEYTDKNVTNGHRYYYRVSAENKYDEGEKSSEVSAVPGKTSPSPPLNLTLNSTGNDVYLFWGRPKTNGGSDITGYNIYRGKSEGNESYLDQVSDEKTSFDDKNLTFSQQYWYYVTAVNQIGESEPSNKVNVTIKSEKTGTPGAPLNLTATAKVKVIKLTWNHPEDSGHSEITKYNIYRGNTSTNLTLIDSTNGNRTVYVDKNVELNHTYYYRVTAINSHGEGPKSNFVSATPPGDFAPGFTIVPFIFLAATLAIYTKVKK